MADEAKKSEAKQQWSPQWGRPVASFSMPIDKHWRSGGTGDLLNTAALKRDGVTAMELHPLGVLVTTTGGQQIVSGMSDIRLA